MTPTYTDPQKNYEWYEQHITLLEKEVAALEASAAIHSTSYAMLEAEVADLKRGAQSATGVIADLDEEVARLKKGEN